MIAHSPTPMFMRQTWVTLCVPLPLFRPPPHFYFLTNTLPLTTSPPITVSRRFCGARSRNVLYPIPTTSIGATNLQFVMHYVLKGDSNTRCVGTGDPGVFLRVF